MLGPQRWRLAQDESNLDANYLPSERYDDSEFFAVLVAAARAAEVGPQIMLERFGQALVPTLLDSYGHLVRPEWDMLDLIASTEQVIHAALRAADPLTRPPMLTTVRRSPSEVVVIYASERQMCGLARGIIRGIAAHYGEDVAVTDETCMLRGDRTCKLAVSLVEGERR